MPHVALLGAGFSRNWGGWLAAEAFEYLLGCPQVDDPEIRELLWANRPNGFEAALAQLQSEFAQEPENVAKEQRLAKLEEAIRQMFADMNSGFRSIQQFEPQTSRAYTVSAFLSKFDAIFTLNQDLLVEYHYLNGNVGLSGRWNGWEMPGLRRSTGGPDPADSIWSPVDPSEFRVNHRMQPYFKLHGSSNWIDNSSGRPLLVVGGYKPSLIKQHPILEWGQERFSERLAAADTRLVIIGYSFRDQHINEIIWNSIARKTLRLFIIDPSGVDVIDNAIFVGGAPMHDLQPYILGASRRSLRDIFGNDHLEHAKVIRFFDAS